MPDQQLPQRSLTTPIPANETERLAALHRYQILDTPPEAAFDRITTLAARLFNAPTALISLVDESRAWFKSCIGFDAHEVPRDATLCSFAVLTDKPLIIPDAQLDDRFACNPFVQSEPGVRFYAGAPLLSRDGFNLGTLCLLDGQPRNSFSAEQQATLVDLAAMVVDELELRLAAHKIAQVDAALLEVAQGVATVTGEAYFDALVQHSAKVLDADYVYIGLVEGDNSTKMLRTIATYAHGQIVENLEYPLQETPCWEVIEQRKICCYPRNVQAQFPNAPLLKPLAVESYVAIPFFDSRGIPLGLLGVMDGKPLENVQLAESLLTIFALRIATELERQQTEAALRESEERYRTLFNSIDEGFCICEMLVNENGKSTDYRFLAVNSIFDKLTGLEQAAGKTARELIPNLEADWFEICGRVVRTGEPARFEQQSVAMNRWFDVHIFCIGEAQNHQFAILFTNITERKRAEVAVRQSEARFRSIFECQMVPMGVYTSTGGIIEANDALLHLIGYTRQELEAGQINWQALTPPQYWSLDEFSLSEIATKGSSRAYEKAYIHKDGRQVPIFIGAAPFLDAPGSGAFFAIDLTERKLAEAEREQLLQREQMARETAENANRIKDEFLAVLSHELRSPLNPILGWARLLQTGKVDAARQAEALKTIERNAKLQSQLIEDLLDISRIMQGKLSLTVALVSLTFVTSAALETVRLAAEAKNIALVLDVDPKIAPISGDATRLQQVVWNLLANAVKFTPNGGQVTIKLRQLAHLVQIRIVDTGKGINPQFLPYIFEYFRQEDGSTTRKFGGLGLGLAIVRQIVEMHGGTVEAESQGENQGATFIVQLPVMQQAAPLVPEPTIAPADTAVPLDNRQILLVDDEPDTREFQAFLLEQSGAKVTAVTSGLEALQVLEHLMPDVIVSDIGMAQIDGYMLIQQIRSRPPNRGGAIPAIALTAYAAEVDRLRAIEAGFQTFITKPVEAETLVKVLVTLLEGNQQ